jgi:hypothetical protein
MIHFVQKLLVFQWCERMNPFWLKQPLFRPFNFLIFKSIQGNGAKAYPKPVLIHDPERPAGKFLMIAYAEGISQKNILLEVEAARCDCCQFHAAWTILDCRLYNPTVLHCRKTHMSGGVDNHRSLNSSCCSPYTRR